MNQILAVIWDYDGTLVETGLKNLNVTRKIVNKITGKHFSEFPAIQNLDSYLHSHRVSINWREYYKEKFGISEKQIDEAGRLWTRFQLEDNTNVPLFRGIADVIKKLKEIPQGVVSQNSHLIIKNNLQENNLLTYFGSIIGYEEVALDRQKPVPDGLLLCIEKLVNNKSGTVLYIGDHETDAVCVLNANKILIEQGVEVKAECVGIFYNGFSELNNWKVKPDYLVRTSEEILDIIRRKQVEDF